MSGCNYRGARTYFVTVLTERRVRHFCDKNIVEGCQAQILRACEKHKFVVAASCYMSDHWHALVRGISGECAFLPFMRIAKQLSGYHVKRLLHRSLWAEGYYDRVVREDEEIMRYVRYIWMNPVVAGLVSNPDDYPYTCIASEFRGLLDAPRDLPGEARRERTRATRPG